MRNPFEGGNPDPSPGQPSNQQHNDDGGQHPTKRIGLGMYAAATLLALGLLTLMFDQLLDKKRETDGAVVRLLRSGSHYAAHGEINGVGATFLVDTGASMVSIPASLATEAGLRKLQPIDVETANGTATVYRTDPVEIRLGDIRISGVDATINPNSESVLLGMSFLSKLEFSQRDDLLILRYRGGMPISTTNVNNY